MVCRDANTHQARPVNALIRSTPEEHSLYVMGERMSYFAPCHILMVTTLPDHLSRSY